jgi:hypothetical protein
MSYETFAAVCGIDGAISSLFVLYWYSFSPVEGDVLYTMQSSKKGATYLIKYVACVLLVFSSDYRS